MELRGKNIVVTGAASGIGRAMALEFAQRGASHVVCADLNNTDAKTVAKQIGGSAFALDVADENQNKALIKHVENSIGPIDLFCANAGIMAVGGEELPNEKWQQIWEVNVMAHVYAARHLVPRMLERGGGYFLNTASAAGLLSQIGSAPYAVTKHAAISFAEWLAITYGERGLNVSVLCPQAVATKMTAGFEDSVASVDGMMQPEDVAKECAECIEEERFLVLPHREVLQYFQRKASDYDRWISGMQRLQKLYGADITD